MYSVRRNATPTHSPWLQCLLAVPNLWPLCRESNNHIFLLITKSIQIQLTFNNTTISDYKSLIKIKSIWKYLMLQPSQFNLFLRIKTPISASFWQLQSQISFLGWHVCNPKWTSTSLEAPSASRMCCECWDAFLLTTFIRRGYLSYRSFSLSFSQPCHSPLASLINKVFLSFFFPNLSE